ncbi:hypothetical protein ACMZOO_00980 [Catenovulum sp. SX2]|uniref:hypothetical protein n=1 Tax=Catenovulum sp. SX2 TaxID=3398614 RepID=UPI003F879569
MRNFIFILLITLSGCAQTVRLEVDESVERSELASVTTALYVPEYRGSVVLDIDTRGEFVWEYLVPEGEHIFDVKIIMDSNVDGLTISWKEAKIKVKLLAEKGHYYIPKFTVKNNEVFVYFEDKGANYSTDCLPRYNASVRLNGSGSGC